MKKNQSTYQFLGRFFSKAFLIIGLLAFIESCSNSSTANYKPTSAGKSDEILWVLNDLFWEDTVGSIIHHKFMKAYDVLPQAEPEYFLRKKNFQQFNNDIIKKYRTIVLCISREDDPQYSDIVKLFDLAESKDSSKNPIVFKNLWAEPQTVILVVANNKEQLVTELNRSVDEIESIIRTEEDKRTEIMVYENGVNNDAIDEIKKRFDYQIDIPSDYFVGVNNDDFMWIRKETYTLSSNFLLYKRVLTPDEIKNGVDWNKFALQSRALLGRTYISTRAENSYMTIEEKYAPILQYSTEVLGNEAVLTKGLWKMENDFMGGPFVNLAWFDQSTSTYYMIDAYVHAPKESKKKYMRHITKILGTIQKVEE